jgi:L-threonylcarbamoyladenylate synthase
MDVITFSQENRFAAILRSLEILRSGGTVVAPTDTVYGILCDAGNESAIRKIFAIKNRPGEKAFPVFVKDIAAARRIAYISDAKVRALGQIWPGPVTIVFHHKEKLPKVLTGGLDTIGIRVPHHPFLSELLNRFDGVLAQTSANLSGKPPAKNRADIEAYFHDAPQSPDLFIDAGEISGSASTVFDFTRAEPRILRMGIFGKEKLEQTLLEIRRAL